MDMQVRKAAILARLTRAEKTTDHEFRPTAEALLATPTSPIHMRLMMSICALFLAVLIGAWVGHVDIYAVAAARIQPTGRSKIIQPLEAGRVLAIHVANGAVVKAGDLLLELDATETAAERATSVAQLRTLKAEIARRQAAIDAARGGKLDMVPQMSLDSGTDATLRERERAVLLADLAELRSALEASDAKGAEIQAQRRALQATIVAQQRLVHTLKERVDMQQKLLDRQLASQASLIDAAQEHGEQATVLAQHSGELQRSEAALEALRKDREHTLAAFVAQNSQALATAQAKNDELAHQLTRDSARVAYAQLRAPIDGSVQELVVTTIGQVVSSGQHLMTIVPGSATLEAEALVLNKDIGFIEVSQRAVLKIDAFPFTRYGTLTGTISGISHDAVIARDALTRADSSTQPAMVSIPAIQDLVYPVRIALDKATIDVGGREALLTPGMSARVEIRTGERRLLAYFLAPVFETVSQSAHER